MMCATCLLPTSPGVRYALHAVQCTQLTTPRRTITTTGIRCLPWCDTALHPETNALTDRLVRIIRAGFLTINSQPRVNGAASTDPVYGWGDAGGYVYQKAYVECFTSPENLRALMEVRGVALWVFIVGPKLTLLAVLPPPAPGL